MQRSNQQAPVSGDLDPTAVSSRRRPRGLSASSLERSQPWLIGGLLLLGSAACGNDHKRPHSVTNDSNETSTDDTTDPDKLPPTDQLEYGPKPADPCDTEGETRECGRVYQTNGDYVTCSVGYQTCTAGAWSDCVGDHLVIKSAPSLRLTNAGLHFQATDTGACTNVCDPYCIQLTPDPTDVSADDIVAADAGGLTLKWHEGIEATTATECTGLQCQLVICGGGATTTISGQVFDPAGKNPLYNAQVYIPLDPTQALPAFGSGASCDTCGGAAALDAIRVTQTDASGKFVLSDVPAGSKIPVVVQMGKWRREILLSSVTACTDNTVKNNCTAAKSSDCVFRLPKNQSDGYDPKAGTYSKADMPQTAIITGSADPFDCLLLKAGIDPNEIGDDKSSKRIHYYTSDAYSKGSTTSAGSTLASAYGSTVGGSTLWNDLKGASPNLMSYDVVLLPCEGGAYDRQTATGTNTPYQNLIDYVNAGGRVFATHYGYSWLAFPQKYVSGVDTWAPVADWTPARVKYDSTNKKWTGSSVNTQDPMSGTVDTSFPKGAVYSQWLQNVGASPVSSRVMLHEGRQDLVSVGSGAQTWMTAKDLEYQKGPTYPSLFTFNTPYGAADANQCGRVVFSDFHVSAAARTQCPSGVCDDECLSDKDCGFTATCSGANNSTVGTCNEPCATNKDCPNTGYSCSGVVAGTCTQTTCTSDSACGYGRTCQNGTCTCSTDADCSGGSCVSKTCDPGATCHKDTDCGKGTCGHGTGSKAGSCAAGFVCHKDSECGPSGKCGSGTSSTKGTCGRTTGYACHKNADCDSNSCGSGTGATAGTCNTNAQSCHKNADCDSNSCASGTCNTSSQTCHKNSDCDSGSCGSGTGSSTGTCAVLGGTVCHKNSDCDSGSCGSGTGSSTGTCAIGGGTVCHANSDCDSGSCGSGTGSTTGVCGRPGGTICHSNAQCDSGSCGSGTGSSTGTCSTNGQVCHSNAQCDSGSCGSGTGAVVGTCNTNGKVCHSNGQCDSGSCGTGANGSVVGTCDTNGKICHSNAQCDSNACGTGANGSVKGTCNGAGTCTSNAQCGGGSTCVGNRCTGTCSVDTNCGTGGLCNNATCTTNKTCANDAACGVSTLCNGATCTTNKTCTSDTACGVSLLCNNATCSTAPVCTSDAGCSVSGLCNNAKCSNTNACTSDAACPSSGVCNGAKCSTPAACTSDAACLKSSTCNGAKCSNPAACTSDAACVKSQTCTGAKCSTLSCGADTTCGVSNLCNGAKCANKSCAGDSACGVSNLCNNAKCSTAATCAGDAACPASGLCTGAKCSTSTCGADSECPLGTCTGATCNASDCSGDSDCASGYFCGGSCTDSGCTSGSQCASGICTNGVCGCTAEEDCGGAQTCSGETQGTCSRSCTTDAECAPDRCVNGKCGGCSSNSDCHDYSYTATCTGIPAGNYGTCSAAKGSEFPVACKQGDLTPQEKALEFMFFDLTACVSPDNLPPPKPATTGLFKQATFVQDFTATCKGDTVPVWRDFDWQAEIPDGSSLDIFAQTGDTLASLTPAQPLPIAHADKSTDTGPSQTSYDIALIDTGTSGSGAFNTATPKVTSKSLLRVTLTLNPTADKQSAPRLSHWKVQYDCVPAQ